MGFPERQLSFDELENKSSELAESMTGAAREAPGDASGQAFSTMNELRNINYNELKKKEYYKHKFVSYKSLSAARISEIFHSTFEVDESTLAIIEDVRHRQPVSSAVIDDIFEQCKQEAIHHTIASFGLGGVLQQITQPYRPYSADGACDAISTQQIVGLIVVEAVAILLDEIRALSHGEGIINSAGWIKNTPLLRERISVRLGDYYRERQLLIRARELGIAGSVSGTLNVVPQILTSLIARTPAFVVALTRECTLSTLLGVQILASKDPNKLDNVKVVITSAASAIVGACVIRSMSNTLSTVPLLNKFNQQVTAVVAGLMVAAVPVVAIHNVEQHKNMLNFQGSKFRPATRRAAETLVSEAVHW